MASASLLSLFEPDSVLESSELELSLATRRLPFFVFLFLAFWLLDLILTRDWEAKRFSVSVADKKPQSEQQM